MVSSENNATLYIDGRGSNGVPNGYDGNYDLNITGTATMDEMRIYDGQLSEAEIRYVAGRSMLDLSGNQYHATPMGSDSFPEDLS